MSNTTEIRPIDDCSVDEIESALNAPVLYLARGTRWNTLGGGFEDDAFRVSLKPPANWTPGPVIFESPDNGPVSTPLTRAILFNSGRVKGKGSAFTSDPRIEKVKDALKAIPKPKLNCRANWVEFRP